MELFSRLGLQEHPNKCEITVRHQLEILGIVVNTSRALFPLGAAKRAKFRTQARRLLCHTAQHRRFARVTDLCRFAGLINSVSTAVVDACVRLPEILYSLTASVTCQARLSDAGIQDLQWWARLSIKRYLGRRVWPALDALVFTDASVGGWRATWNGMVLASSFSDAFHEGRHINELELLAALYGLNHSVQHASKRQVEMITDGEVTEHIVRKLTSRFPLTFGTARAPGTVRGAQRHSLSAPYPLSRKHLRGSPLPVLRLTRLVSATCLHAPL